MRGRTRLATALGAAAVFLAYVGVGDAVVVASDVRPATIARASGDGGSATYSGAGPGYTFDLTNSGTTSWRYVYLVAPAGSSFTGGQITNGASAPCEVGQPDGTSNEIECGPFSSGGAPGTHVFLTTMLNTPVACGAPFQLFVNSTGVPPYTRAGDATFSGSCGGPPKSCDAERAAVAAARAKVDALGEAKTALGPKLGRALAEERAADEELEKLRHLSGQTGGFLELVGALDKAEDALSHAVTATRDAYNEYGRLSSALKAARRDLELAVVELAACGTSGSSQSTVQRTLAAFAGCGTEQAALVGAQTRATVLVDATKRFARTKLQPAELRLRAAIASLGKVAADRRARAVASKIRATQTLMRKADAIMLGGVRRFAAIATAAKTATTRVVKAKAALAQCQGP